MQRCGTLVLELGLSRCNISRFLRCGRTRCKTKLHRLRPLSMRICLASATCRFRSLRSQAFSDEGCPRTSSIFWRVLDHNYVSYRTVRRHLSNPLEHTTHARRSHALAASTSQCQRRAAPRRAEASGAERSRAAPSRAESSGAERAAPSGQPSRAESPSRGARVTVAAQSANRGRAPRVYKFISPRPCTRSKRYEKLF